jgi:hypothetical protein
MVSGMTRELIKKSKDVVKVLVKNNDTLSKQQVIDILGSKYSDYYSVIVSGLAYIEKITKKSGRTGGIQFKPDKAKQRKLVARNLRDLATYFDEAEIEVSTIRSASVEENDERESDLYEPLKKYLETTGLFSIVEIYGDNRGGGGKWKNPDLIALNYSTSLRYHAGIFPKLTAIEVKYQWPAIRDIQQTASYLRFCHSAYLCLHDQTYTGKNIDSLTTRLRDEEIWEWATINHIGLIVAYSKQKRSPNYDFQIIKEAPETFVDSETIEQGIDTYFSEDTKKQLADAVRVQIKGIA